MINPVDLVNVKRQANGILGKPGEVEVESRNALEALVTAVDGVLTCTSRGLIPTPAPAAKPQAPTSNYDARLEALERKVFT